MKKRERKPCVLSAAQEMDELVETCDHIVFNSVSQYLPHRDKIEKADKKISVGLRINPECSTQEGHGYMTHVRRAQGLGYHERYSIRLLKTGLIYHVLRVFIFTRSVNRIRCARNDSLQR